MVFAVTKAWRKKFPANRFLHAAKARAKKSGREFTIVPNDIMPLPTHCPILGLKLNYDSRERTAPDNPSMDRVHNDRGYVPGNVVIISHRANSLKSHGTAAEHRAIADWMDKWFDEDWDGRNRR